MARTILLAIAGIFFAGSAFADTQTVDVRAGRSTVIGHIGVYNSFTCLSMAMQDMRVSRAPGHGSVRLRRVVGRMTNRQCRGKKLIYYRVTYTPRRGYRGSDQLTVDFKAQVSDFDAQWGSHAVTYRINVR